MKPAPALEEHFTPAEVCARLRLSRRTLFSLMRPDGLWPVVRLSKTTIRVPASSVARYLKSRTWAPREVSTT